MALPGGAAQGAEAAAQGAPGRLRLGGSIPRSEVEGFPASALRNLGRKGHCRILALSLFPRSTDDSLRRT